MLGVLVLTACAHVARAGEPAAAPADTVRWFQATEQALMDSIALGDKVVWDRVMDSACVITSEEGQVLSKGQFLDELRPLPPGLTGRITVKELTVQEFPEFAVVRFLADEWESVFGQKLATKYRVTDTFRRDGKAWRMVASHFAVVTQNPQPQTVSSSAWPGFVGAYRLLPEGWTFHVELRDGKLYGGRDQKKLKPLIPLTPDAFVLSGSLGEWLFVTNEKGKVTHILNFRKFEPLVWTRVESKSAF
ncbi:MAG: nuclear transport factor 2 family protein [Thermoanaerobaculia bacterium]